MKLLICRNTILLLLLCSACGLAAQPPARARSYSASSSAAKLETGLVIVPFAVPVAVPVATVRQPSVLYSFRSYAAGYGTGSSFQPGTQMRVDTSADPDAANILTRRCAACHSGASSQGGLRLFDDTGGLLAKLPRRRVLESVEAGRMPKPADAPRLTPAEIEMLRQWAQPPRELEY